MTSNEQTPSGNSSLATTDGELERFENPGFPEHGHRLTDIDPIAAKRSERQIAGLFVVSMLGTLLFIVSYFVFTPEESMSSIRVSNLMLGLGMGISLFAIGVAAVLWAKNLMPDHEFVEERHDIHGSEEDQAVALEIINQGKEESGIARRPLIRNTLIAAMALMPLPAVLVFRDLGPLPGNKLHETLWDKGIRLAKDPGGIPESPGLIKASDVTIGSVFHVIPENLHDAEHALEEKAKSAVLLMRLDPSDLKEDEDRKSWSYNGIVAYSKICTHVGCPVALYEHQTHHLLCPCHQSTFDVTEHCKVIFGPAKRPLPQLPITVDSEGYLVAQSDFPEPVGASFWELNQK
ncbi:Rieske 2Fe-2S domain-containing protein [Saxibacter everestensis]|uniref:Cytochrome bc1 complex Rieske iron-sulfur subunit n=1 Tax=Saxibacter everestensis TaxID=2909229 RepID=A0ABY8QWU5_9MICO|nr:Rieske 2Fe-2S domain-containing protein [Brevibacteriaceae bacterium ZFBP1038]